MICGGKSSFGENMAKTRILSTDLIWKFHEKLNEFEKYALHGISIAIVADGNGEH
jgi:hypothetical protein